MKKFDQRGNELTWNSDGIIFVDQTSIPNSDIYILFPYLFKKKHPKNLCGFQDFVQKISEMGLDHLIVESFSPVRKKEFSSERASSSEQSSKQSSNYWYIGP